MSKKILFFIGMCCVFGPAQDDSITVRSFSGEIIAVATRDELKDAFRNLRGFFQEKAPHLDYAGKIAKLVCGPATSPEIISEPKALDTLDAVSLVLSDNGFRIIKYPIQDTSEKDREMTRFLLEMIRKRKPEYKDPKTGTMIHIPNASDSDLKMTVCFDSKFHYHIFENLGPCSIDDLIETLNKKLLELGKDPENTQCMMLITNLRKMPRFTRENLKKLYDARDNIHSLDDIDVLFED